MFYYRPQRSWGKVIFWQASVILSTGGGVSAPGGGCLLPGGLVWGQSGLGGVWSQGVSGWGGGVWSSGGVCSSGGAWWRNPPGRLLLRAGRILLECILVKEKLTRKVTWYLLKLSFADIYSGQMPFRISFKIKVSFESCGNKSDGWYTLMYKCPEHSTIMTFNSQFK